MTNEYYSPHDENMERAVLGDMLLDRDAARGLASMLTPECFYNLKYKELFAVLLNIVRDGQEISPAVLTSEGKLSQEDLAGFCDSTEHITLQWKAHGVRLVELKRKRELLRASQRLYQAAMNKTSNDAAQVTEAEQALENARKLAAVGDDLSPETALNEYLAKIQSWKGNKLAGFGIPNLDNAIGGGIFPGQIMVILGGEGTMKTSLALQFADNYLKMVGGKILYLSLDMKKERVLLRRLMPLADMSAKELIFAMQRNAKEYIEALEKRKRLDAQRFGIIGGAITLDKIDALLARHKPDLVIWDFLTATAGYKSELDAQRACVERLRKWQASTEIAWLIISQMSEAGKAAQLQGEYTGRASGGNNLSRVADIVIELKIDDTALIASIVKSRDNKGKSSWELGCTGKTMSFTGHAIRMELNKKQKKQFKCLDSYHF